MITTAFPGVEASVPVVSAFIGVLLLLFGRRIFWLCVAAIGFAAGVELAPYLVHEPTQLLQLTLALLFGFIGALLALFLQKLAIGLAGFLAGGRLAVGLAATFFTQYSTHFWPIFIIGGVIGALVLLLVFDWALIFISSLIGAYLVTTALPLPPTGKVLLLAVLVVCGALIQMASMRRTPPVAVP